MRIKSIIFLYFIFIHHLLIAQSETSSQYFIIKGKVSNNSLSSWELTITGFFDPESIAVPIQPDGTFKQIVPIEGMQDLYLFLNNDVINIYAQPNDTIEISWDEKNFDKTFAVRSPQKNRNNDFQLNVKLFKDFRPAEVSLLYKLRNERKEKDIIKFNWINELYNQQLKMVIDNPCSKEEFVNQIYFKHLEILLMNKLLDNFTLNLDTKILNANNLQLINRYLPESFSYKVLNNVMFYKSPEYREFIYNYMQSSKLFTVGSIINSVSSYKSNGDPIPIPYTLTRFYNGKNESMTSFSPWKQYYYGLSQIELISIRDWFITKTIFWAFQQFSFEEAESVLNDFLPKCQAKAYKDTLIAYKINIKKFNQGMLAPDFTLKDENGKSVSLSDFKGKVIYIDFWSVSCVPCRVDIKNFIPKLHEEYKNKDIVFINICVDVNEEIWKKTLSETKLDGINLLAKGFVTNQVCKDYNVNAVPHYFLIDKYGKFADSKAPNPDMLINNQNNQIDKLLMDK